MFKGRIRLDRNELAGAFGDIGTDLPLIIGMIPAAHLDAASVLILYGSMQVLTALAYGIPMPVQPLKFMAMIVITRKLDGNILYGGGLAIGIFMTFLAFSGLMAWIARVVPKTVVRGIQFALGAQLATMSLKNYVPHEGKTGYALAAAAFILVLFLLGNRKYPAALFVILLGVIYAFCFKMDFSAVSHSFGFRLPQVHVSTQAEIWEGFILLALPQLGLSVGNSILATQQVAKDYFPGKSPGIRKISFTYSLMNLINPFFGGIPTCHGSGGMVGHYTFGARTGGSVAIYGTFYLLLGFFFSRGFEKLVQVFPQPILGVILLFEGLALVSLIRDVTDSKTNFFVALLVGLIAMGLPMGYVVGLLIGPVLAWFFKNRPVNLGS